MSDPKKCSNPACSCVSPKGEDFCSTHCEATNGSIEMMCECGHPGCRGDAAKVLSF